MRDYAVTFKGWNGKRPHLVIVRASNRAGAIWAAYDAAPGWLTIEDVTPIG